MKPFKDSSTSSLFTITYYFPKIAASAASQAFCAAKPWRRANSFRPSMPNCPWGAATNGRVRPKKEHHPYFVPPNAKRPPCGVIDGGGEGSSSCIFACGKNRRGRQRSRCRRHMPPACDILAVRLTSRSRNQKRKTPLKGVFFFGGGEGSRTPVRKRFDKTFSGRS